MPKVVDKELMNQQIVFAALQAFVKHGFHNTSMSKIASEMGIAKGTLYLYFKSKNQLIEAITKQHFHNLKDRLVSQQNFNSVEALLSHIQHTLLISDKDSQFIPVFFEVFGPSFSSDKFINEYCNFFNEIAQFYTENLESLQTQGLIQQGLSPKYFGRVFVSMLDGIILHKGFFKINNTDYNLMVKEVIKLLRHGLISS